MCFILLIFTEKINLFIKHLKPFLSAKYCIHHRENFGAMLARDPGSCPQVAASSRPGHTNIELKPGPLAWQVRQIHQEGTAGTVREDDVSSDLGRGGSEVHPERGGGTGAEGSVSLCKGPEPGGAVGGDALAGAVGGPGCQVEVHTLEPTEPFK